MEFSDLNMTLSLILLLGFGSSLIHYSAYAKNKVRVEIRSKNKNQYLLQVVDKKLTKFIACNIDAKCKN